MSDSKKTLIVTVLDRSGSMSSIRDDMIGGFNEQFVQKHRELTQDVRMTLYRFDNVWEKVYENISVRNDLVKLNTENFEPRGGTALYDAIARSINDVGTNLKNIPEYDRPSKVVFIIITDGYENSSNQYTSSQIREMIKYQELTYDWQFVYLGANQDACLTAQKDLGLNLNKGYSYIPNKIGTEIMFNALSQESISYCSNLKRSMDFGDQPKQI